MERTISFMNGKGSIGHNSRAFIADNVRPDRTKDNESYFVEDIKDVYHHLFDEALNKYNAKQKRKDRKIKSYYEKIKRSKQEKLFYEVIVQIGNCDDSYVGSSVGKMAKQILKEYLFEFIKNNPNLYVIGAYIHMDEETPHMHIDFVPWVSGCTRGLETKNSLKGALASRGFKSEGKGYTEWQQWAEAEKESLAGIMKKYGIEWEQKGTHNPHLSVLDYKKQEREKEIVRCDELLSNLEVELADKKEEIEVARIRYKEEQEPSKVAIDKMIAENGAEYVRIKLEIEKAENELKEVKELLLETRVEYEKERILKAKKLNSIISEKENELNVVKKKLDDINDILKIAKIELRNAQTEVTVAKKLKLQLMQEMDGEDYLKEQVIELRYQNMVLKEENQNLKEKLNQAYEFMKQFVIEGMNMLEKFKLWIGEKVRDVWKR